MSDITTEPYVFETSLGKLASIDDGTSQSGIYRALFFEDFTDEAFEVHYEKGQRMSLSRNYRETLQSLIGGDESGEEVQLVAIYIDWQDEHSQGSWSYEFGAAQVAIWSFQGWAPSHYPLLTRTSFVTQDLIIVRVSSSSQQDESLHPYLPHSATLHFSRNGRHVTSPALPVQTERIKRIESADPGEHWCLWETGFGQTDLDSTMTAIRNDLYRLIDPRQSTTAPCQIFKFKPYTGEVFQRHQQTSGYLDRPPPSNDRRPPADDRDLDVSAWE